MTNIYNLKGDIIECQHCGKRFPGKEFTIDDEPKDWQCPNCKKFNKSTVIWKVETIAISR